MDAGFVLLERERGPLPQHHHAKCIYSNFPIWLRALQYKDLINARVPDES